MFGHDESVRNGLGLGAYIDTAGAKSLVRGGLAYHGMFGMIPQ